MIPSEIWAHCILLGHKPIIDVNPRRSVDMKEALKREKKARRTLGLNLLIFPPEGSVATSSVQGERRQWAPQG